MRMRDQPQTIDDHLAEMDQELTAIGGLVARVGFLVLMALPLQVWLLVR